MFPAQTRIKNIENNIDDCYFSVKSQLWQLAITHYSSVGLHQCLFTYLFLLVVFLLATGAEVCSGPARLAADAGFAIITIIIPRVRTG